MGADLKKLDVAILYLQRITEGKNPVNNMPATEDDVLNNENVIRCMEFVKEILEEVKGNDGYVGRKPRSRKDDSNKAPFPIETLKLFKYESDKAISVFEKQLNALVDTNMYQTVSYKQIRNWLIENGYLEYKLFAPLEKEFIMPTKKGEEIGVRADFRASKRGNDYIVTMYNQNAQEFIVKNMEKILNGEVI